MSRASVSLQLAACRSVGLSLCLSVCLFVCLPVCCLSVYFALRMSALSSPATPTCERKEDGRGWALAKGTERPAYSHFIHEQFIRPLEQGRVEQDMRAAARPS